MTLKKIERRVINFVYGILGIVGKLVMKVVIIEKVNRYITTIIDKANADTPTSAVTMSVSKNSLVALYNVPAERAKNISDITTPMVIPTIGIRLSTESIRNPRDAGIAV